MSDFLSAMNTDEDPASLEDILRSFRRKNGRLKKRIDELKHEKNILIYKCVRYRDKIRKLNNREVLS